MPRQGGFSNTFEGVAAGLLGEFVERAVFGDQRQLEAQRAVAAELIDERIASGLPVDRKFVGQMFGEELAGLVDGIQKTEDFRQRAATRKQNDAIRASIRDFLQAPVQGTGQVIQTPTPGIEAAELAADTGAPVVEAEGIAPRLRGPGIDPRLGETGNVANIEVDGPRAATSEEIRERFKSLSPAEVALITDPETGRLQARTEERIVSQLIREKELEFAKSQEASRARTSLTATYASAFGGPGFGPRRVQQAVRATMAGRDIPPELDALIRQQAPNFDPGEALKTQKELLAIASERRGAAKLLRRKDLDTSDESVRALDDSFISNMITTARLHLTNMGQPVTAENVARVLDESGMVYGRRSRRFRDLTPEDQAVLLQRINELTTDAPTAVGAGEVDPQSIINRFLGSSAGGGEAASAPALAPARTTTRDLIAEDLATSGAASIIPGRPVAPGQTALDRQRADQERVAAERSQALLQRLRQNASR